MEILIISLDHLVQRVKTGRENTGLRGRKDILECLLKEEIRRRNVQFIAEEADPRFPTIAQRRAISHKPCISWKNIDMTEDERKLAGIYDALRDRPTHIEERNNETVEIEYRIPQDDIREEFFVKKTLQGAGHCRSILFLCGDMHSQAIKRKFERCGHLVEIDERLIADRRWV